MSPQVGVGFNRTYWRNVEHSIQTLAKQEKVEAVYVFTGPLFIPDPNSEFLTTKYIGKHSIPVPSHYFKALLVMPGKLLYTVVLPNKVIDKDKPLLLFCKTVDYVEHWAGFDLWSALPDGEEVVKEAALYGTWEVE